MTETPPHPESDETIGEQLTGWGKVVRIETRGRTSGRTAAAAVGYVEEPDGALLVAAGSHDADWARNLIADPACRVILGEQAFDAVAELLEGPDFQRAIRELILRYGTPSERLGHGPAFRLRAAAP